MARHINLLDVREDNERPVYLSLLLIAVPVGLVLLGSLIMALMAQLDLSRAKSLLADADGQLTPLQEQLAAAQSGLGFEQANADLRLRIAQAERSLKSSRDIDAALQRGELGDTKGFSGALRAFALHARPGVWITQMRLEGGGQQLAVRGQALSADAVGDWVRALRNEALLDGRSIRELRVLPVLSTGPHGASAPLGAMGRYRFVLASGSSLLEEGSDEAPPAAEGGQ